MRRNVIVALVICAAPVVVAQRGALGPSGPTPRLADGTPNLGRAPGEKGVWNVPWIRNMGLRIDKTEGGSDLPSAGGVVGLVGHDLKRDGSRLEPLVPFMPWSAALYDYHVANESKYDPEGYCLPPGGPRMMATPYPMEIIQLPEQKRIFMTFEGGTHIWREIYIDGRPHPSGDALNPTYLGHSVGHWDGDTLVVDVVVQRGVVDRLLRTSAHRPAPGRREIHAARQEHVALRSHDRRPRRLHEALDRRVEHRVAGEW